MFSADLVKLLYLHAIVHGVSCGSCFRLHPCLVRGPIFVVILSGAVISGGPFVGGCNVGGPVVGAFLTGLF